MKSNKLYTWPCGHKTSVTYRNWPNCPVCALENGQFLETLYKINSVEYKENQRKFNRSFLYDTDQ